MPLALPVFRARTRKLPIGLDKGRFQAPPEFFEPLPADVLASFEGKDPAQWTAVKLLLDTCTFLWIAIDAPGLSRTAKELFSDP